MKASIKFREDQKPILRAKVPLNILGFPFQSGIEAGDTKELCLNFSTLFEFGPLLKLSYRPKDSWRPFSFSVRTGIGHFGSPIGAPMTMSAEFNFLGNGNPRFFLHFRPQIGDFSIKRSVNSQTALPSQSTISTPKWKSHANDGDSENDEFFENNETPVKGEVNRTVNDVFPSNILRGFPAASAVERLCSGVEVYARTVLPLRNRAALKLRWSVRYPADEVAYRTAENWFRKIPSPCLVLSKMGIEHVPVNSKQGQERKFNKNADVAEACLAVTRELDVLQAESGLLRRGLDEFRSEIVAGKGSPAAGVKGSGKMSEFERNGGKKQKKESKSFSDYNLSADKVTDGNSTTVAGKPFDAPGSRGSRR